MFINPNSSEGITVCCKIRYSLLLLQDTLNTFLQEFQLYALIGQWDDALAKSLTALQSVSHSDVLRHSPSLAWPSSARSATGEGNRSCSSEGNMEEPLSPQDRGKSPHAEMPRGTGERRQRRLVVWVVVLVVLVALVLALAVAVAALSAGRCGGDPAVPAALVLACPDDWVGYHNVCYSFSRAEGSWEWSQEQCSSHGASLAMPRREGEMEFLWSQKAHVDYWLGLRRQGERLQWVDGSSFNQTFEVQGQGECAYLYDGAVASAGCSQSRPYICSKPQALG
ncbi:C-type lectin domain family 2 member D-like isoform X2 [Chroicocephalus ridibundus]|uniref:C-type lectin domain family 2 member D-like isoform X2 n=1 Tax=Chroicocephalus ridibundus TaxID=1192867 RepID=UPI002FDE3595